jgi:cytochrome c oxidase assembly protein subunit 11
MVIFVFFGLVPFYDKFCQLIGIGERTNATLTLANERKESEVVSQPDKTREIKVQVVANNNADIGWEFKTLTQEIKVNPGALNEVHYYAKNITPNDMVGQAVHSVTPPEAGLYFHKTECFCFRQQPLKSGQAKEMPLKFVVDKQLPAYIKTITVSYTMFNAQGVKQRTQDEAVPVAQ